jgi:hypothetical protein
MMGAGAKWHINHSEFLDLPYDDGDFSYSLFYQAHDKNGYLEALVEYAPTVNGDPAAEYVITPQANFVLTDRYWRAGFGALSSYIKYEDEEVGEDWTDVYWQFMLGLGMPVGRVQVDAMAHYVFEKFDALGDFDFGDIEYSAAIKFAF